MGEEEEFYQPNLFWGVKVPAGQTVSFNYEESSYLIISNVSLAELPENPSEEPCELSMKLSTVDLENYDDTKQDAPQVDSDIILATLRANIHEHDLVSHTLSPLNSNLKFTAKGPYDIYVSGYYAPFEDDEYDYEEEYEEEEGEGGEGEKDGEAEVSQDKEEAANKKLLEFVKRHTQK